MPELSSYLDEMIHLEGHGDEIPREVCGCEGKELLLYRCWDCFGAEMVCRSCVLQWHAHNPLHRVKEWGGTFFVRVSLKLLGLHVQLGHNPGEKCYNPEPAAGDDFIVIDVHGIHEIGLDFYGCEMAQIHYKQLIHVPHTAATFTLMEFFHLLTFESKVSAYKFYHSIARWTDNTSITPIRDHYSAFMRMVHQWRNLKGLKRAGRGHDPSGVDVTSAGECVVFCLACPHPGKNLPEGWEDAPQDTRWKYALFLTIDTNFWLKRKLVSSDHANPSLNAGLCYFKSICVSHNVVNMADTKSLRGLAATGIGTVDCARHEMKLPNGVTKPGARYLDMDYLVFSVILGFSVVTFNLSYDITCQWHKKLWTSMTLMPARLHLNSFSFNFGKNVGHTDGEAPKRGWANINRVASSTKEMGPGACCNTLDDHFLDWNWKKVMMLGGLGKTCSAKSKKLHQEELDKLQQLILASSLSVWKSEIEAWEEDNTWPNPFESRVVSMTQAAIHRQLAEKEATDLQAGVDVSLHANISPSVLIASDISALGQHATDTQKTKIYNQSNTLQFLYMPAVAPIHGAEDICHSESVAALKPEQFQLWLPSQLDPHLPYSKYTVHGQCASTCACTALNHAIEKKHASKDKYDAARDALIALAPLLEKVGWTNILCPLGVTDMRPMGDFIQGQSEGTHDIPWIWKTPGVLQDNDEGLQDFDGWLAGLRIKWCKARAEEARWSKKLLLLLEEMQRVLTFLAWQDSEGSAAYAN
ncbi:hypothetical protein BDR03DRAFT_934910 [Suillus americanus]|nr:hypothetical protein BDR03DRAFT_934910 [Suillus americanus]